MAETVIFDLTFSIDETMVNVALLTQHERAGQDLPLQLCSYQIVIFFYN